MTDISDLREMKPHITVLGVGGAGGNAVNNMITAGLQGVDFVVANTDAQALAMSKAARIIQMGMQVTRRSRGRFAARSGPRRGRGSNRGNPRSLDWRAHGIRHRRHGWRHWHRRSDRHREGSAGAWNSHHWRRHQTFSTLKASVVCALPRSVSLSCRKSWTPC